MNKQHTVLVVDDEYREHLVERYTMLGCTVVEAADGQYAIDKLNSGLVPDVILTDLTMPRVDGNGLIEWVAAQPRLAQTRIAFITGRPENVSKKANERAQAVFYKGSCGAEILDDFVLSVPCNHTTKTSSWTSEECPMCGDDGMRRRDRVTP